MLPSRQMVSPLRQEDRDPRASQADDAFDQVDVPAAVVCAHCGESDCPGCPNELSRSGIVAIIAWERPNAPVLKSMWQTARAATRDAEVFFESLPDGPIAPALRFAILCELIASTCAILMTLPFAALLAPTWLKHVAFDPRARDLAIRLFVLGVPALAALLVLAHAVHGLSLDRGAAKSGAKRAPLRALRFGLYATGWDIVIGPVGAIVVAFKEGIFASIKIAPAASGLPTRSARAFLRGCYRLEGKRAAGALATSNVAAVLATLIGAIVILASAVAIAVVTS
jgi:hypothetical protein